MLAEIAEAYALSPLSIASYTSNLRDASVFLGMGLCVVGSDFASYAHQCRTDFLMRLKELHEILLRSF